MGYQTVQRSENPAGPDPLDADRAGFVEWVEKLSVEAIAMDEERFLDRSRTRAYVIEEHVTSG
jgi:hypothetical protein